MTMYWSSAPASIDNILIYSLAIEPLQVLLQYIPYKIYSEILKCYLGQSHRSQSCKWSAEQTFEQTSDTLFPTVVCARSKDRFKLKPFVLC